jgi:hypothetical protein
MGSIRSLNGTSLNLVLDKAGLDFNLFQGSLQLHFQWREAIRLVRGGSRLASLDSAGTDQDLDALLESSSAGDMD